MQSVIELARLENVLKSGETKSHTMKQKILFLEQFWHIPKLSKNLSFSKYGFQQHIRITQENLQVIRQRDCSIGNHFK